ncbi:MAG TPA: hypothetical protein DFI01_06050 [Bacteroidales bacterium]|nr:hypothetical protein [Bacteroidales bacterium]
MNIYSFIKPWTAVRDGETNSQQFLTPSIIEGIRQKLGVKEILRHKLTYSAINLQQEETQSKALKRKDKAFMREHSIIKRGIMVYPTLILAFSTKDYAEKAIKQHICLCRNEDVLLPFQKIEEMEENIFNQLDGFELRFGKNEKSFMVGYNRFDDNKPMYGWIEITGNPIQKPEYEQL